MGKSYRARRDYWNYLLSNNDAYNLLQLPPPGGLGDDLKKRNLFCKYVDVINIETSSYCNRKCDYCPLTIYPRKQNYMDKRHFEVILRELDSIGYDNRIALNLYNEPLLDKYICDRIGTIKRLLPKVYVQMNSNGDYLTKDLLKKLINEGLDQILITLHPLPDNEYDDVDRENELAKFLEKINIYDAYKKRKIKPNENITVEVNIKRCKVYVVCNNWRKYGNDRGGHYRN